MRYLWVDRYCIDQDDVQTKHVIIQRMDEVYKNASVTIINAAGTGPDSGLPGVSIIPRRPLWIDKYNGMSVAKIPNVKQEVSESVWSTRGCE
jgi:hypothetical protein